MTDSLRVMVVDDEPTILQSCTRVLERAGHRVRALSSARAALELFDRESFDLILTDIMMPDLGGLELIQRLKERAPAATIVVITGYGTIETATEALRRGASGFLSKPFTPAELRAAVAEAFTKGQLTRDAIRTQAYEPLTAQIAKPWAEAAPSALLALLAQSTRSATGADLAVLLGRELGGEASCPDRSEPTILALDQAGAQSGGGRTQSQSRLLRRWLEEAVVQSGQPLIWTAEETAPALPGDSGQATAELGIGAALAWPVHLHGQPFGALAVLRIQSNRPFGEGDQAFLRIQAHQATAILETDYLHRELKAAYLSVVVSLTHALEARDAYTGGHCERMSSLGSHLAGRIGLDPEQVEAIRLGGILHDIGKIGVPDAVLLKAGALTSDERVIIEQHTDIGARIVEPIKGLRQVLPIVRHHHERFDGRGYPAGLAGSAIPIGARILGVCDAYEAMTSSRPYRPALPLEETLERLRRGSGTQFDPEILAVFFQLLT